MISRKKAKTSGACSPDLLSHFRNLILFQVSKGDLSLMEVSEAEAPALKEQSTLATTDALTRILEVLAMRNSACAMRPSKKILLEVTLLRAIEARNAVSIRSRPRSRRRLPPVRKRPRLPSRWFPFRHPHRPRSRFRPRAGWKRANR
jgi:DNA polymerase III gamma/tau subunit